LGRTTGPIVRGLLAVCLRCQTERRAYGNRRVHERHGTSCVRHQIHCTINSRGLCRQFQANASAEQAYIRYPARDYNVGSIEIARTIQVHLCYNRRDVERIRCHAVACALAAAVCPVVLVTSLTHRKQTPNDPAFRAAQECPRKTHTCADCAPSLRKATGARISSPLVALGIRFTGNWSAHRTAHFWRRMQ